jgi:outer membrane protein TolC
LIQAERAQKLAIRQNEELAVLSFKTYQLGRASLLEVLSAQNAAMEARSQWVRTRVELASLVSAFQWNLLGTQQESTL